MEVREYAVTLHKHEDLDSFYFDMESQEGTEFISDRKIKLTDRRPTSRSTHYLLTDVEAELLKRDPRVQYVELSMQELGLKFTPSWTQTSIGWNKSSTVSINYKNWGLKRCVDGAQTTNWGTNGTTTVSGTITTTSSGKNVDVVVVDGQMDPAHPEFAVNPDGTGGSRINQYNWFLHNGAVLGTAPGTYVYTPYVDPTYPDNNGNGISDRTENNDHGTHVAGIFAGNSQGWARDSTIYNICPYSTGPSFNSYFLLYIKEWHKNKPINPLTGRRNPTITNHSYGITLSVSISNIVSVRYRGVVYTGPFTSTSLTNYGIFSGGSTTTISYPYRYYSYEQDLIDLTKAGIIVVGASGNSYTSIANYSDPANYADDYNNYIFDGITYHYYNRGTISAATGIICVGNTDATVAETKVTSSNCGSRIDVYAPGRLIMSSVNSTTGVYSNDSRNTAYKNTKKTGTSMSSPQVAGILACLAESWPNIKQSDAVAYLVKNSKLGQMTDTAGGPSDQTSLQGSTNRYLYYKKERPEAGIATPKQDQGLRPSKGMLYPRPRIYRYGR